MMVLWQDGTQPGLQVTGERVPGGTAVKAVRQGAVLKQVAVVIGRPGSAEWQRDLDAAVLLARGELGV